MRLTQYDLSTKGYDYIEQLDNLDHIVNKLGQLEDIEEELGIDLVTLFKALKNGIYINEYNHGLMYGLIVPHLVHECGQYYFKHYGDFGSEEFSFDEYGEAMPKYLVEAIQRYYNKKNKGFLSLEELL